MEGRGLKGRIGFFVSGVVSSRSEEGKNYRDDLLAYCRQDRLAMVRLLEVLCE
jgi:hypothetical protein